MNIDDPLTFLQSNNSQAINILKETNKIPALNIIEEKTNSSSNRYSL